MTRRRKLHKRLEQLEARRLPWIDVQGQRAEIASDKVLNMMRSWGVEQRPSESLAETLARGLGISYGELRVRLQEIALGR